MKINFCCGTNRLEGWNNVDCDIQKPTRFLPRTATHIFLERGLEKLTHQQAWVFLNGCYRILKPNGMMRVNVLDITEMWSAMTPAYRRSIKDGATPQSAVKFAMFEQGHQSAWNSGLLETVMTAIGFKTNRASIGCSFYPEFKGIEGRWKTAGKSIAEVDTSVVEGVKA